MITEYLSEILPCCYNRNKYTIKEDYIRCDVCRHKILKKNLFLKIERFNTSICSYNCHTNWLHKKKHIYHYNSDK